MAHLKQAGGNEVAHFEGNGSFGVAVGACAGVCAAALPSGAIGFDFNPVADRIRVVGVDGTREECTKLYQALARGYLCISKPADHVRRQELARAAMISAKQELRGKKPAAKMRPLSGRTALVTGSTSGIGLGVAEAFAAQGLAVDELELVADYLSALQAP